MYTRDWCGYCAAARRLLDDKGVAYLEINVTGDKALRDEARERSGRRTVPQIFINAKHVGGYDDLALLDEQGDLDRLLHPED